MTFKQLTILFYICTRDFDAKALRVPTEIIFHPISVSLPNTERDVICFLKAMTDRFQTSIFKVSENKCIFPKCARLMHRVYFFRQT